MSNSAKGQQGAYIGYEFELDQIRYWSSLSDTERVEHLLRAGVSDGLPLAPVSVEKVIEGLRALDLQPEQVVTTLPPLMRPVSAGSVAIWSLIAGCDPSAIPVVLASVEAVATEEFNALGVLTTTGTAAIAIVVSGSAAANFRSGCGLLGPGGAANAAVGRALGFVTRCVGGAVPSVVDMSTMGQPGKYTFCFAEDAASSPWPALHATRGVPAPTSAVTVFAASGTAEVTSLSAASASDVLATLAASMYQPSGANPDSGLLGGGTWLVVISPEWATLLAAEGASRTDVCRELSRRAQWTVSQIPDDVARAVAPAAGFSVETIRAVESPDDLVLVVGGGVGIKQTVMPAWSGGTKSVTVKVRGS